jgi:hypothetical protein
MTSKDDADSLACGWICFCFIEALHVWELHVRRSRSVFIVCLLPLRDAVHLCNAFLDSYSGCAFYLCVSWCCICVTPFSIRMQSVPFTFACTPGTCSISESAGPCFHLSRCCSCWACLGVTPLGQLRDLVFRLCNAFGPHAWRGVTFVSRLWAKCAKECYICVTPSGPMREVVWHFCNAFGPIAWCYMSEERPPQRNLWPFKVCSVFNPQLHLQIYGSKFGRLEYALDMPWICLGYALHMPWICLGYALDMP